MPTLSNMSLTVIALLVLALLWTWQRNHPSFDLSDLITGDNGKVSSKKFMQTGAWVVATWGFVTLIQDGKMNELYFTGYMTVSFGARIAHDLATKGAAP